MLCLLPPAIGSPGGTTPPRKGAVWSEFIMWLAHDHPVRLFYLLYFLLLGAIGSLWLLFLYLT
jgi:hypothetical protein